MAQKTKVNRTFSECSFNKLSTGVITMILALTVAQSARAHFIVDFRLGSTPTDTTKTLTAADANTDVPVQVWGTVLGAGTLGIAMNVFRALSQQVGGGAFTTGGVTAAGFSAGTHFNNAPNAGSASDVSIPTDGIADLGQFSGDSIVPPDARVRATTAPKGSTPGYYTSQGGWTSVTGGASIQLGTFTVHIGALTAGGTTQFAVGLPTNSQGATWFENAASANAISGTRTPLSAAYTAGTSVSFVLPPAAYNYALTTHNDATLGTSSSTSLPVSGSNHNYISTPTNPSNSTAGNYHIANGNLGVGAETPVLVMVEFDLGSSGKTLAQLAGLLADVSTDTAAAHPTIVQGTSPDARMNILFGQYPTFVAAHTLLFEYNSVPGGVSNQLNWGFDLTGSGITVTKAIAVPEPASLSLWGLGVVGLLGRRRGR